MNKNKQIWLVIMAVAVILSVLFGTNRKIDRNYEEAHKFFEECAVPDEKIDEFISGIKLSRLVSMYHGYKGERFVQYQFNGQGDFYTTSGVPCEVLGVNCEDRVPVMYELTKDTVLLKSIATSKVDTWTDPDNGKAAYGGGVQFYTCHKENFRLVN